MKYRLEIVTGRHGLDADHIAWRMFHLTPCSQTPLTTTYASKLPGPLTYGQAQIMEGWIEEGDIIGYVSEIVEE